MRQLLQKQLREAWSNSIATDYQNQRINSERSLQASLWAQLNKILPPKTRRMFIEPSLTLKTASGTQTLYPDLVICNSRQVIGVVELKYQPRVQPLYHKDIQTLRTIAANRSELQVANSRYRGDRSSARVYQIADKALFVWAGVHREQAPAVLFNAGIPELEGCFLELHAETRIDNAPHIFWKSG